VIWNVNVASWLGATLVSAIATAFSPHLTFPSLSADPNEYTAPDFVQVVFPVFLIRTTTVCVAPVVVGVAAVTTCPVASSTGAAVTVSGA